MLRTVFIRKDGRCRLYFEEITATVRALIYNNSEGLNHQQISKQKVIMKTKDANTLFEFFSQSRRIQSNLQKKRKL